MDEAGLGKTLETLSFIKASPITGNHTKTLIVCPASLIAVWLYEIHDKFPKNSFKIFSYYGIAQKKLYMNKLTLSQPPETILQTAHLLVFRMKVAFGRD